MVIGKDEEFPGTMTIAMVFACVCLYNDFET